MLRLSRPAVKPVALRASNSAHEPGSGTGILPVLADRLEALFHYARAAGKGAGAPRFMGRIAGCARLDLWGLKEFA